MIGVFLCRCISYEFTEFTSGGVSSGRDATQKKTILEVYIDKSVEIKG